MQSNDLKEQLTSPSRALFMAEDAGVDLNRDVALSVGRQLFGEAEPTRLIEGIVNMEAYFHHLRSMALEALKTRLDRHYGALKAIELDANEAVTVHLEDGQSLPLPGHTSPALNELVARLDPAEGSDNPRLCLEMIQQAARLMEVMGMSKLAMQSAEG